MVIPDKPICFINFSGCPSNPENPTETQVYRKNSTENSFRILILGDSLTEGYGVSAQQAFPSLLEKKTK